LNLGEDTGCTFTASSHTLSNYHLSLKQAFDALQSNIDIDIN